jgi:Domain of unknown function (DUF4276)
MRYDIIALLVDSEDPLVGGSVVEHLRRRDRWDFPPESADKLFLMTQCMESWFLADRRALTNYYGQHFRENSLPGRTNIEEIPKRDVQDALTKATISRDCQKGTYHKTRHGFSILALINPKLVELASLQAKRFHDFLRDL